MPRHIDHAGHPAQRQLTFDEELELIIGPAHEVGDPEQRPVSNFPSDEDRREAWLAHERQIREACLRGEPWAAQRYGGHT